MLASTSGDESFALTEKRLIQRSNLNDTSAIPNGNRKNRPPLRNDLLELALGCCIFVVGAYLPKPIVGMFLNMDDLITKVPPMLKTKAGDSLVDLQLNEPLVEPATVSSSLLILMSIVVPTILLFVTEAFVGGHARRYHRPALLLAAFFTAIGVCEGTTQVIKLVVQRKRPNFYALCGFDGQTCAAENTEHIIEAQLSFPSGHSSLSMCAAVFIWYYGMTRIWILRHQPTRNSGAFLLLRRDTWLAAALTFGCIGASVACGVTRLVDHWHHPSDVLAGWILGATIASAVFRSQTVFGFRDSVPTMSQATLAAV